MYATSNRLDTWLNPSGTTRSRQYHELTMSCLFQQKDCDKVEVSTSRGGTGARCARPWLTRDIV